MPQSAIDQSTHELCLQPKIAIAEITQMASDLFTAMLGLNFDATQREMPEQLENPLQSSIKINGDWNAEVRVVGSKSVAAQIACAMFGKCSDELEEDEINDAFGEVVNVIGGNAKGIINGECQLSLPAVAPFEQGSPMDGVVATFTCDGHPITIQSIEFAS